MTYTAIPHYQPAAWQPVPAARRRTGVAGLTTSLLGVAAIVVSFTTLTWFTDGTVRLGSDTSGKFGVVHDVLIRIALVSGFQAQGEPLAAMYFSWLGWGLLVAVTFAAVLANTATAAAGLFRVIGGLLALGAVGLTFAAIDLLSVGDGARIADPSYGDYLSKTGPGFYVAVAGFALLAVGSLLGSRKQA